MKVRSLLCALALGLCVQLLPGAFGQTEPNPPSGASQTTQQPASPQPQVSAPAAQSQPTPAPPAPQQKQPKVKAGSKDD
ncbi:MAG TPA: hypothetical protein VJP83_04330, partial [Terriglobales bacterium]|nr:hypothetical protein [Terriglobales bacterium]